MTSNIQGVRGYGGIQGINKKPRRSGKSVENSPLSFNMDLLNFAPPNKKASEKILHLTHPCYATGRGVRIMTFFVSKING